VSYTTIIDVPNPGMQLKPGMTATVTVEIARAEDTLKVPTSALRFTPSPAPGDQARPQGRGSRSEGRIWILDEGQPRPVPVTPGLTDGATTAIADGALAEGTRVITGAATATTSASTQASSSPFIPQRRGASANASRGQGQTQGGQPGGGR
jgi:HlyD family secretion protein